MGAARACAAALTASVLISTVTEPVGPVTALVASTEGSVSPLAVTKVILMAAVVVASEPAVPAVSRVAENAVPVVPGGSTPKSVDLTRYPRDTGDEVRTLL